MLYVVIHNKYGKRVGSLPQADRTARNYYFAVTQAMPPLCGLILGGVNTVSLSDPKWELNLN